MRIWLTTYQDEDFNEADLGVTNEGHPDEVVLGTRSSSTSISSKEIDHLRYDNPPLPPPLNGQHAQSLKPMAPQVQHGQQGQVLQSNPMATPQTPGVSRPIYTPQNKGPSTSQNQRFQPQRSVSMVQPQIPPSNGQPYQRLPHDPLPPYQPEQAPINRLQQVSTPPRNQTNPPSNPHRPLEQAAVNTGASNPINVPPQVGFFTAKAAESLQQNVTALPPNIKPFNPHAESPSIRKTPGIDHTKTAPVNKDLITLPAQVQTAEPGNAAIRPNPPSRLTTNFVNPQGDQIRRIGMPGAPSPLQNRHSYKPPQMLKRPAEGNGGV